MNERLIHKDTDGIESLKVSIANWPHPNETQWQNDSRHKEAAKQHVMLSEQHEAMMNQNALIASSHKHSILAAWAAVVAALATCTLVYLTWQNIELKQVPTHQQQAQSQPQQTQNHKK